MSDGEQKLFDFGGWLDTAKDGLKRLEDQRDGIDAAIRKLEGEREGITKQIKQIKQALGMEAATNGMRDRGVKAVLEQIADGLSSTVFDDVVKLVRSYKPTAKESSIRSALARLVRDGILTVDGGRGEKRWTWVALDAPPSPPPSSLPPTPVEEKFEAVEDVFRRKLADALDINPDGVDAKTIAHIAGEAGLNDQELANALSNLDKQGRIEGFDKDGQQWVRYPAQPGSVDELKRTSVGGKMLFEGAERPPHA